MPKKKLTAAFVDKVKASSQTDYYDDFTRGLGLRVSPGGAKTFFYRYRFNGKNRRYTIARFTRSFTLADARKKVDELRSYVKEGGDPVGDEQERKRKAAAQAIKDITFRELTNQYKAVHLPVLREKTRQEYNRIIDVELIPAFGNLSANDLTRGMVILCLDEKAIKNGKKTMANRIRARLHSIYEFGVDKGIVEHNPVSETKPYKAGESESERFYTEEEIRSILQAIEGLREPARSYLKIITLTGQRRTETQYMMWNNLHKVKDPDFKGWIWTIPKERSKSGRDHEVPLSPHTLEIIKALQDSAGDNPYVFASHFSKDIPFALKTIKRATKDVRDESGVSDFRLHDMRRTVATWLAKLGTPAEVVSKVLNHKTGAGGSLVTRIYNRYEYRAERQRALNRWGHELQRILEEKTETKIYQLG